MRLLVHVGALVLGGLTAGHAANLFSGASGWAVPVAVIAMSALGAVVYASVVTTADHLVPGRRSATR